MSEEWDSYFCNVNDKLASIRVDLGIRSTVPDPNRPWLLWVWVYFERPRVDGMRTTECVIEHLPDTGSGCAHEVGLVGLALGLVGVP